MSFSDLCGFLEAYKNNLYKVVETNLNILLILFNRLHMKILRPLPYLLVYNDIGKVRADPFLMPVLIFFSHLNKQTL